MTVAARQLAQLSPLADPKNAQRHEAHRVDEGVWTEFGQLIPQLAVGGIGRAQCWHRKAKDEKRHAHREDAIRYAREALDARARELVIAATGSRALTHGLRPYAVRTAAGAPPDNDLCRSRFMSLGEMIPTSRPPSMIKVRPSLQPSGRPSRLVTGSVGPAVDTLSSGQMISLIRVVARASGATFFRAVKVKSPLRRPSASWVGKVECRDART